MHVGHDNRQPLISPIFNAEDYAQLRNQYPSTAPLRAERRADGARLPRPGGAPALLGSMVRSVNMMLTSVQAVLV